MNMLLALLLACKTEPHTPSTVHETDTDTDADTDTGVAVEAWVELAVGCALPEVGEPPLSGLGEDQHTQRVPGEWFVELVDVELSADGQVLWGAGQGGLMGYDVSDSRSPELRGYFPTDGPTGRFYRVEVVSPDRLYVSHRGYGFGIADISDVSAPQMLDWVEGQGYEGMALSGDRLYVADIFGGLFTYDVTDRDAPVLLDELSWDGTSWDVVTDGAVAYIADNGLGVVPVDLSLPDQPAVAVSVDIGSGVQDLAIGGDYLYAAAGGGGVVVLDRTAPLAPVEVARLEYGGSVQSVALDGDILWAVNQEDVIAVDVRDPTAPVPLGSVTTPEFAMHVAAGDGVAWVGDWSRLSSWSVDIDARQPDLDLGVSELFFREEAEVVLVPIRNTGGGDLHLLSAESSDARVSVRASQAVLAPGEAGELEVSFSGGSDLLTSLCLVTDDPERPQAFIELHTGEAGQNVAIGEPAVDFVLTGLDGETYQLSEQLGSPVVLAYFATW